MYSYPQQIIRRFIKRIGAESLGYKAVDSQANRSLMRPVYAAESPLDPERDSTSYAQARHERLALTSSWVFSNIDIIGKEASTSSLRVFRRKGEENRGVEDHPLERIIRRPNPWMGSAFLKRYTASWLLLRGEAYWMLVPDKQGNLKEVWPLPSSRVFPIADPQNYIKGYGYTDDNGKVNFLPPENICYFREPNPYNYHRGLSKLVAYILPLLTDLEAAEWNKETFSNEAVLRTVLSIPADVQRSDFEIIKDEIIREVINGKKRYIIARAGEITAKQLGMSQREMEFLSGREFTREEIDRVFNVPGGFWDKSSTEANAKVAREIFTSLAVWPMLVLQAEEITSQIIQTWYGEEDSFAAFDDIRPKNREQDLAEESNRIESMTVNEVRELRKQGEHPNSQYGALPWRLATSVRALRLFDGLDSIGMANGQANILNGDEPGAAEGDSITPAEENAMKEENGESQSEIGKAAYVDIRRYRSISLREFREKGVVSYHFKSDILDEHDLALARSALALSSTEEQVKAFFSDFSHTIDHLKAVTDISIGDNDFDPELQRYQEDFDGLVARARSGEIERGDFEIELAALITAYLTLAYEQGGGTDAEANEDLQDEIKRNVGAVSSYADDIYSGLYASSQEQTDEEAAAKARSRSAMWIYAMAGAYAIGKLSTGSMLIWSRGATQRPCFTCLALDGVVRSADDWAASGYRPQARNGKLDCGGYYCQCAWYETDSPATGSLP